MMAPSGALLQRHETLDVARGVAVLGILWFNIFFFALPFEAMVIPAVWGEWNTLNDLTWDSVTILVAGVMRGMFSILFGASALLLLAKAERLLHPADAIDAYFRRLIWLIIIGALHAYLLLWPHDVLYAYGILGMLVFPFRHARPKTLIIFATIALIGSTIFTGQNVEELGKAREEVREVLPEEKRERLREADPLVDELGSTDGFEAPDFMLTANAGDEDAGGENAGGTENAPSSENADYEAFLNILAAKMTAKQQGYLSNLKDLAPESFEQQTTEMITNHLLDIGAFLLFGMALFKLGFLTGEWSTASYWKVALAGYLVGVSVGVISRLDAPEGTVLGDLSAFASQYTFDLRRFSLALANFALIALWVRSGGWSWLRTRLRACGRMALTLYLSQTIVCNFIFLGYGLSQFAQLEHHEIAVMAVVLSVVQLAAAPIILSRWKQGPLEAALRRLITIGSRRDVPDAPETVHGGHSARTT